MPFWETWKRNRRALIAATIAVVIGIGFSALYVMRPSVSRAPASLPYYHLTSAKRPLRSGTVTPAGKQAATLTARPKSTKGRTSTKTAQRSAVRAAVAADAGSQTLTFSEFPEGTPITDNYAAQGVVFASPPGNAPPFIASDGSNPTSPVLSGSPLFSGNIVMEFVLPGTQTRTRISAISLDVGYIDNPGSVQVLAYSPSGIEVLPANATGIVHLSSTVPDISAVEVVQSDTEPAGFAIDNVSFTPGTVAATGLIGGPLTPSESNGQSNPGENLCECGVRFGGDPVNTLTGNFTETYQDVTVIGPGPGISLDRTYNAQAAPADGLFGHGWSSTWEASLKTDGTDVGSHATVTFGNGATVTYTLTGLGWFAAPRVTAKLSDQSDGSRTLILADGTTYTFDPAGLLVRLADRNNRATSIARPDATSLIATDDTGRETRLTLNGGDVVQATDPAGSVTRYGYDDQQNLTQVTDPLGHVTAFGYDGAHHLTTITTPTGRITRNQYNSDGQVTQQTDPGGGITTFTYGPDGVTRVTQPDGMATDDTYTSGLLTKQVIGVGTPLAETYTYDYDPSTAGRIRDVAADGTVTTRSFDANGNLLSTTDGLGRTVSYTYNSFNEPTSMTYPSGRVDTADYDAAGNLIASTVDVNGLALTATYTRNAQGDLTDAFTPLGAHVSYSVDAAGNVVSTQDADGNIVTTERDALGRPVKTTAQADPANPSAPGSRITQTAYDALSRATLTTAADGGSTRYEYDADGRLARTTAPGGRTTADTYSSRGDLTKTTTPDGAATTMTYDPVGRILSHTDATGATTRYSYDALGRPSTETDGLGRVTTKTYDPQNRLSSRTSPSGDQVAYTYDKAGQLLAQDYATAGTPSVAYTYTADGQRATQHDGTGTTTYRYDTAGRLTGITDGAGATVTYRLDRDGRATTMTYPNGQDVTRTFNNSGALTGVTDWLGRTTTFTLDPFGSPAKATYGNGITSDWAFTATGQPAQLTYGAAGDTTNSRHSQRTWRPTARASSPNSPQLGPSTTKPPSATR